MAKTMPAAAPVRPGGAISAGSTSDMEKTPATPLPANAGHSQRQGSASGNNSNPTTPPKKSEAATRLGGRRRWIRCDQLGKNRIAGRVAALKTANRPAVAVALVPASPEIV